MTSSKEVLQTVVISGKGGTGKTSVLASFAALASDVCLADCDVDAADLHLVVEPEIQQRHPFISGHEAKIDPDKCSGCGVCYGLCRFAAVLAPASALAPAPYSIDPIACEGCGVCVRHCPNQAIEFPEGEVGEWYISQTRLGPMVHARLGIGAENSGKLVSEVRKQAKDIAQKMEKKHLLIDGPPGIACPVIASITGVDRVVIVSEPTLSGLHDLERVLQLTQHFRLKTYVCVNKWDINPEVTERIERVSSAAQAIPIGRIPWDPVVTAAQLARRSVIEHGESEAATAIRNIWEYLCKM